ncbi:MAG: GtrA family protein [Oscillospiraceae bacterium]|nr:GtrA family protein [Oscillospiraceae bacterium]
MLEALLQFVLKLLPKPLKKLWDKYESVWRYCYYGAWTTLLSIVTKLVGRVLFDLAGYSVDHQTIPSALNTTASWIICAVFAFFVNKKYVFHSETKEKNTVLREMLTFFGGRGATYFIELLIMETPALFGWNYILMVILSQFIVLALNYIISKLFVFRKKKEPAPEQEQNQKQQKSGKTAKH